MVLLWVARPILSLAALFKDKSRIIKFHSCRGKVFVPPTCTRKSLSTVRGALAGAMEGNPRSKNFSFLLLSKFDQLFLRCKSYESLFSCALSPKEQVKTFVFVFAHSFSFISTFSSYFCRWSFSVLFSSSFAFRKFENFLFFLFNLCFANAWFW